MGGAQRAEGSVKVLGSTKGHVSNSYIIAKTKEKLYV